MLSNLEKNNMGADICHNEVYTPQQPNKKADKIA
jgi:hypothetical protein